MWTIHAVRRSNHFKRMVASKPTGIATIFFFYRTLLNTVSTTIVHVSWMNWKPLYPTPLPTFRPWRCKQSLRTRFVVFGYVCNMLVHIFKTSCNKTYCEHLIWSSRLKKSSYHAYDFRQDGPSLLIHDVTNISINGFSLKTPCMNTRWHFPLKRPVWIKETFGTMIFLERKRTIFYICRGFRGNNNEKTSAFWEERLYIISPRKTYNRRLW
jgi:hypothetical protein